MVTNQSVSNRVDPDSVEALIDWFYFRFVLSRDTSVPHDPHELWAHVLFGFAPNYRGELYAGVPDMVLRHRIPPKYGLGLVPHEERPSLKDVQEGSVRLYNALSEGFLQRLYDPWSFGGRTAGISQLSDKIVSLCRSLLCQEGERLALSVTEPIVQYYERRLIPPDKRLPPELFDYAEQHFGSMPPRDEEEENRAIVNPEDMKQRFPQYAAGMEYFCGIIDKSYAREPFEDRYNRVVSKESRAVIAEHEEEILAVFQEMEPRVKEIVSSLGDVKTLEPLSPERIQELYDLCVRVDGYIKEQTGQYPHEMTLDEIRALPIEFLVRIREEFPWPHFDDNRPSSVGGTDDPRLVFACLLAEREEYGG